MKKDEIALVLMDLQNDVVHPEGLFGKSGLADVVRERSVLENSHAVLERARQLRMLVVHVAHQYRAGHPEVGQGMAIFDSIKTADAMTEGSWGAEPHEMVAPIENEIVVPKRRVSSFYQSDLDLVLRLAGIKTIVSAGVATNMVVEATVRDAADRGFANIVLEDCCASFDAEDNEFSLKNIIPKFGRVITTLEFLDEFTGRS
ncbi:cysteine hydrolase family protein [Candidatus Poriferisodalis sp.]|uniref:cysteine hydrolase family protein n=1 Tax=Candidatus Poriferisodalis sp. TaxID=3101277 RepID=UPI003D0AA368